MRNIKTQNSNELTIDTILESTVVFYPNIHKVRLNRLSLWVSNNYTELAKIVDHNYGNVGMIYVDSVIKCVRTNLVFNQNGICSLPSGEKSPDDLDIVIIENMIKELININKINKLSIINRNIKEVEA